MEKKYFYSCEYWGKGFHKFQSGVMLIDLDKANMIDVLRDELVENDDRSKEAEIKVLSFNNID